MNIVQLRANLRPAALVECIYSCDMAEDGRTLCVMCDMADGSTVMISACPGRPITSCVVEVAGPAPIEQGGA
jgi:hypothetical protein